MYELKVMVSKVMGTCTASPPTMPGDSERCYASMGNYVFGRAVLDFVRGDFVISYHLDLRPLHT